MDVPYSMAAVYQAQGRYDDAIKLLQDLVKKTEKSETGSSQADRNNRAIFIERLGMVYREQENYTAAVETFRKMLPLGDENARSGYQEIIDTYREAKQWPQATAVAKEAVQKMPDDRDLRMVLDAQLADTGEFDKSVADIRTMLKGGPEDREVYLRLGIIYTRAKRWRRRPGIPRQSRATFDQARRQGLCFLPARRPLPAPENVRSGRSRIQESSRYHFTHRSAERRHAQLSRIHECRSRREARRVAQLHQAGSHLRAQQWRLSRLAGLGLLQARQVRSRGRKSDQGRAHMGTDPTVQEHLGDLYQKTGRLKLAAAHWDRAVQEWNKTVPAEQDAEAFAKVQQKLDAAKVKLAKEESGKQ